MLNRRSVIPQILILLVGCSLGPPSPDVPTMSEVLTPNSGPSYTNIVTEGDLTWIDWKATGDNTNRTFGCTTPASSYSDITSLQLDMKARIDTDPLDVDFKVRIDGGSWTSIDTVTVSATSFAAYQASWAGSFGAATTSSVFEFNIAVGSINGAQADFDIDWMRLTIDGTLAGGGFNPAWAQNANIVWTPGVAD